MVSPAAGRKRPEGSRRDPTAPAAMAPEKPATKEVHPVQKPRDRSKGLLQIDILAASAWPQGREFSVRHGSGEGEDPTRQPHTEHANWIGHALCDESGHDEDTAPDNIGNDDGGTVEGAKAAAKARSR